jgi:hypothetical protein
MTHTQGKNELVANIHVGITGVPRGGTTTMTWPFDYKVTVTAKRDDLKYRYGVGLLNEHGKEVRAWFQSFEILPGVSVAKDNL